MPMPIGRSAAIGVGFGGSGGHAGTAADLLRDAKLTSDVKAEFDERRGPRGYDCPIPPEVKPAPTNASSGTQLNASAPSTGSTMRPGHCSTGTPSCTRRPGL